MPLSSTGDQVRALSTFISHSSQDAALAQVLYRLLVSRGVRCWISPQSLDPGVAYAEGIVRGIDKCDSLIVLLTQNGAASDGVLKELEQANKRRKTVLTVMIGKPSVPARVDYYISALHWMEGSTEEIEDIAKRLSDVLQGRKAWPDISTPPTLLRRFNHAGSAFLGYMAAPMVLLFGLVIGGWFYLSHQELRLSLDYRSLGWVTFGQGAANQVGEASEPALDTQMQVWVGDAGTPFRAIKLLATARVAAGGFVTTAPLKDVEGNGTGYATVDFRMPLSTNRLATCLVVPSTKLGSVYLVRQHFRVTVGDGMTQVIAEGKPVVSRTTSALEQNVCL